MISNNSNVLSKLQNYPVVKQKSNRVLPFSCDSFTLLGILKSGAISIYCTAVAIKPICHIIHIIYYFHISKWIKYVYLKGDFWHTFWASNIKSEYFQAKVGLSFCYFLSGVEFLAFVDVFSTCVAPGQKNKTRGI